MRTIPKLQLEVIFKGFVVIDINHTLTTMMTDNYIFYI